MTERYTSTLALSLTSKLEEVEETLSPSDPLPESASKAAVALRAFPLRQIAEKIGVSVRAASSWRTGEKTPTAKHRAAIEVALKVPQSDWFLAAENAPKASTEDAPPALVEQLEQCSRALARTDLTSAARSDLERFAHALRGAIAHCQRQAARARRERNQHLS